MGEMKERMLRGDLYIADDPDLAADFARAQELVDRYNRTSRIVRSKRLPTQVRLSYAQPSGGTTSATHTITLNAPNRKP